MGLYLLDMWHATAGGNQATRYGLVGGAWNKNSRERLISPWTNKKLVY